MNGLDFSFWRPPSASWLIQNGFGFACRYLDYLPNGKVIDAAEFAALRAAGVLVVLNWEDGTTNMAAGFAGGQTEAAEAMRQAQALGAWPCPITFSCDTDPANIGQAAIVAYLQGCGSVLGGALRVGVYGGHDAVAWGMGSGAAHYGWQTFAWSPAGWYGPAQLRQVVGGTSNYDLDQSLAADFGQVGAAVAPRVVLASSDS
jgi:hypothetical protein